MNHSALLAHQHAFVSTVLPDYTVLQDRSWGIIDTTVLVVRHAGHDYVVKAYGPNNAHLEREYEAFMHHTKVLGDRSVRLVAASESARTFVLHRVPGILVLGSPAEYDPATHEQAGALLRTFHEQASRPSAEFELQEVARALERLAGDHKIPPATAEAAHAYLHSYEPSNGTAVPTHGDYQPRNWLIDNHGIVRVIDFGRFAWRAPESDFCFLHTRQWRTNPACEAAFFRSYGADPRTLYPNRWKMYQIRFGIGAAAWGHQFGQTVLEQEGLEVLTQVLRP